MFWADNVAKDLQARKLPLEWVDDMKTPSGRIHVGALRGVVVHDLLYKALKDLGVQTKYTYVFEDHDPMDDIPSYLSKETYEKYLGMPLFTIPSPKPGYENYARYYASEFEETFRAIGCNPEILWTKDLYTSGRMNGVIKECLDNAAEIRKIYEELYKKKLPSDWYPFQVYCPNCGKVSTTRVMHWDGKVVSFVCDSNRLKWTKGCGTEDTVSPFSYHDHMAGKLPWKVEWACKWKVIGVTVEGAGKDHMSSGGSHDLAKLVCERVIHYPVPYPIAYEWILVGGRKMSSSRGVGVSAHDMLEILPKELIRFLMVKIKVNQQINFDPSERETIPRLFDEYQKAAKAYFAKTDKDLVRIFELSQIDTIHKPPIIRFSVLSQWVQMPDMEAEIKKQGLSDWAKYAKIWVEKYAPESERFVIQKTIPEKAKHLSENQKSFLQKIAKELDKTWQADEFQKQLYEWVKQGSLSSKEAFSAIYLTLIGKDYGPKAAWLILSLKKDFAQERFREAAKMNHQGEKKEGTGTQRTRLQKPEIFSINGDVREKFSSISVGVAVIKDVTIEKINGSLESEKGKVIQSLLSLTTDEINQFQEVQSYRKLYKAMGIDWHSRRPSPEALLRRAALKKGLSIVNTCVDAYNLIVMRRKVSVGAFDYDKISFPTVLRFAKEGEKILLLGDADPTEYKMGELAYFDQEGGYNIDLNYRDAQRTAVQLGTKNLYINVDGAYDITPDEVEKTLRDSCAMIIKYCGGKVELFGIETASS